MTLSVKIITEVINYEISSAKFETLVDENKQV